MSSGWIQEPDGRYYFLWTNREGRTEKCYQEEYEADQGEPVSEQATPAHALPRSQSQSGSSKSIHGRSRRSQGQNRNRRKSETTHVRPEIIVENEPDQHSGLTNNESQSWYHKGGGDGQHPHQVTSPTGNDQETPQNVNYNARSQENDTVPQPLNQDLGVEGSLATAIDKLNIDGNPQYTVAPLRSDRTDTDPQWSSQHHNRPIPYEYYTNPLQTQPTDIIQRQQWQPMSSSSQVQTTNLSGSSYNFNQNAAVGIAPQSTGRRHIVGTEGEKEPLDENYRQRNTDYKRFFRAGRVFLTLWTEAFAGNLTTHDATFLSQVSCVIHGEKVYSKIRRFVVVKQMETSCLCLPVTTYDGRGHKKRGIKLEQHGQIYSHDKPRKPTGIKKDPLKVVLAHGATGLNNSLINYGKVYCVEANVKVRDVGKLDHESEKLLKRYFKEVVTDEDSDGAYLPETDRQPRDEYNELRGVTGGTSSGPVPTYTDFSGQPSSAVAYSQTNIAQSQYTTWNSATPGTFATSRENTNYNPQGYTMTPLNTTLPYSAPIPSSNVGYRQEVTDASVPIASDQSSRMEAGGDSHYTASFPLEEAGPATDNQAFVDREHPQSSTSPPPQAGYISEHEKRRKNNVITMWYYVMWNNGQTSWETADSEYITAEMIQIYEEGDDDQDILQDIDPASTSSQHRSSSSTNQRGGKKKKRNIWGSLGHR
ncbi:hypothetical protein B0O99DRAFT_266319 [Bisporella sp. PMI_857]|nr:hypothetical protein B0O99DRAFT_266319 [Bisporella sp. PMI_857]